MHLTCLVKTAASIRLYSLRLPPTQNSKLSTPSLPRKYSALNSHFTLQCGRARSDVFDGPACRGFPEVKRTFGFCFRSSVVEVKKISPAAPHHRKVSAPRPPLRLKTQPKSHSPTAFAATSSSLHHPLPHFFTHQSYIVHLL